MLTDFRYALRSLARARWFTVAAALTCALGIGISLAVFSVVDRMLFRPLPFADPDALVQIHRLRMSRGDAYVLLDQSLVVEFRRRSTSIEDLAFVQSVPAVEPVGDGAETPPAFASVSWNLLRTLGIRPVIGSDFSIEDVRAKRQAVLLTHEAWRQRFGSEPGAPGRRIAAGRTNFDIVGVLPPGFILPSSRLTERIDGLSLAPVTLEEPPRRFTIQAAPVARLRNGVTPEQAQAELNAIVAAIAGESPELIAGGPDGPSIEVHPLRHGMTLLYRPYLLLIVAGVLAVLALACINLSTLLVARGRLRDREMAIRVAIGASGRRLVMTTVMETGLVAALGSLVAWIVVRVGGVAMASLVPPAFRGFAVPATDTRVIAAAVIVAAAAGLLSSVVPARQASRRDVAGILQQSTRSGRRAARSGRALLAVQTALAALLVTGAALSARSYSAMAFEYQGTRPEGLYRVSTSAGYTRAWESEPWRDDRAERAIAALAGLPAVIAVGAGTGLPFEGLAGRGEFWPRDSRGWEYGVSASMFDTLGVTPLAGRVFSDDEVRSRAPVAVLSAAGARALFPGADPASVIGHTFPYTNGRGLTVVGVIADISRHPGDPGAPLLFVPTGTPGLTHSTSNIYLAVRVAPRQVLDEQAVMDRLGRTLEPGPVTIEYIPDGFAPFLHRPRFQAALFGALSLVALIVAAIGLFALTTVDVTSRRYEIGVRMSLGATARDIHRQVVRSAIAPVLIGAVAGLVAAFWAGKFLQAFLFDVDARDFWTQGQVALVLIVTAACAAWLPARRAARVDPVETLRAA